MVVRWRVLDFSSFEGELRSIRGGIEVVRKDAPDVSIPIADVALVLVGQGVHFGTAVLHRLCSADVAVLFCDWRGVPEGGAYSWSDHGRVAARHRAQASLSEPRRKNAWGRIVHAKITGQAAVLKASGVEGGGELISLASEVRSGDPGNVEAQAARRYWRAYLGKEQGRFPGAGELLGWNACLDYGYSVLRGFVIRSLLAAGLCGSLGVFHRGRGNVFALADDLIEPVRPCIDSAVRELSRDASPSDPEVKRLLVAAATRRFTPEGLTVQAVLDDFAQQFGMYVEGDVRRLSPPVWQGPQGD